MAGDWIKMRINLDSDPRVIRIAAQLAVPELHVVGMLWKVWAWADSHSLDGNALCVTDVTLDRFVDRTGFAVALRNVGWLEGRDNALSFPRFAEHNGQTAKKRGETQARVAKHRAQKGNANGVTDVTQNALPEKRREEKKDSSNKESPPKPPEGEPGGDEVSKSKKRKRPIARSTGPSGANVTGIEIDGELVLYDADPLRWEAAFIAWWNALPGVHHRGLLTLDTAMRRMLLDRLSEPDWTWQQARARFPLWTPSKDWVPTLSWFLEPVSLSKIMEGRYEPRAEQTGLFANRQADPTRVRTGKTDAAILAAMAEAAPAECGTSCGE